jgi:hemin uptake protein HemP
MNEPGRGAKLEANASLPRTGAPVAPGIATVSSDSLFGGARELLIRHGTELYRLRSTSKGKLILTK